MCRSWAARFITPSRLASAATMPKLVRPSDQPPQLDDYISVFGNRARMTIIKFLQENGPSLRNEICTGTDMANPTLGTHLVELERIAVISSEIFFTSTP